MADGKKDQKKSWIPSVIKRYRNKILIVIVAFVIAFGGTLFEPDTNELTRAELLQKVQSDQVAQAIYHDDTHLTVKLKGDSREWEVTYPKALATDTFRTLAQANVSLKPEQSEGFPWASLILFVSILSWVWLLSGPATDLLKKARTKANGPVAHGTQPTTRLADVKGIPEVVAELSKIGDILKRPDVYKRLGARLPAGVVLYGPPGTGKTMLAEALAGEAGVPFYGVTGSAIRSKWIGDAGKAIRAHFEKARKHPVSIIFFDEGDTLGARRSESTEGGHQEHRAQVNELLAQMNPNRPGGKVFVVLATNNPDLLDDALTRPGRIDLKLAVLPPDVNGRRSILETHTQGKAIDPGVDLDALARETYGRTGADLEGLVNNALLEAGRHDAIASAKHFEHALTIMNAGPARTGLLVSEHDKRVTAFHEAGHALCAAVQDMIPNPTSVTILAHGQSGGHTRAVPDEERESKYTARRAAVQELVMCMGGVVAEKLALKGDFTNGAASDRKNATDLAIDMVCYWGMGTYNSSFGAHWRSGPHADIVWEEIEGLLDEAERTAFELLLTYKKDFDKLVEELLEKETLRAADLRDYHPQAVTPEELASLKEDYKQISQGFQTRTSDRLASHRSASARMIVAS